MATIHWLNETGGVEAQPVCAVDFADDGMTIDFAHNLYRSVHAFGRSKQGFAIRSEHGRDLYAWRWDDEPAPRTEDPDASPGSAVESAAEADHLPAAAPAPRDSIEADRATAAHIRRSARWLGSWFDGFAAVLQRRNVAASPTGTAVLRFVAPDMAPKARRWRPEIDHYLLAIIVVLGILCGSPLCSIYATVQNLLKDETFLHQDRAVVAHATRAAASNVLATDGKLDFRKLFWHLRVVGPTEIHLLAYEPSEGQGPRLIFETSDLLRWHLQSVRGADGTWWARSELAKSDATGAS